MATLEEIYKDDPALLNLYKRKLIQRGWAGRTTPEEKEFIAREKRRLGRVISSVPPQYRFKKKEAPVNTQ